MRYHFHPVLVYSPDIDAIITISNKNETIELFTLFHSNLQTDHLHSIEFKKNTLSRN